MAVSVHVPCQLPPAATQSELKVTNRTQRAGISLHDRSGAHDIPPWPEHWHNGTQLLPAAFHSNHLPTYARLYILSLRDQYTRTALFELPPQSNTHIYSSNRPSVLRALASLSSWVKSSQAWKETLKLKSLGRTDTRDIYTPIQLWQFCADLSHAPHFIAASPKSISMRLALCLHHHFNEAVPVKRHSIWSAFLLHPILHVAITSHRASFRNS